MKTFSQFCNEAYDKEVMSGSQIKTMGAGGRIAQERKKTAPERKRMKTTLGPEGKTVRVPAGYKPRKDIGTQKPTETRVQQPEKERGSKEVKQSYAEKIKAERIAAAKARSAARKAGTAAPATKEKGKDLEKQASALLSKKTTPTKKPSGGKTDNMIKGTFLPKGEKRPYTRGERVSIERAASALRRDILKGKEKPAAHYKGILKPGKLHVSEK